MDRFVIEGVPPYSGEYELDLGGAFTNRELHTLKQIAGIRAGELEEAADMSDNDLVVAFSVIALQRAGYKVDVDVIWNAEVGKITFVEIEEASEESPPAQEPPAQSGSGDEKPTSSGEPSSNAGDRQESDLSRTGPRSLGTSATSDRETLAS